MRNYVTRDGDTLAQLATRFYGSSSFWRDLLEDNPHVADGLFYLPTSVLEGGIGLNIRDSVLELVPAINTTEEPLWPFETVEQEEAARARYSPPMPSLEQKIEDSRIPWLR